MHVNPAIAALLEGMNHPSLPGIDLSLERMAQLLAALGHPERKLPPVIHVAGTNGKGSAIAFMQGIYQAAGYTVHRYTSPHLVQFNERFFLAGMPIGDAALLAVLQQVQEASASIPVTFFEATTAAAFLVFSQHPADLLLLEVGLGGRLDATNLAVGKIATVITPIALDHREFLGDTLAEIAREKAGIMTSNVPCVTAPQAVEVMAQLEAHAAKTGCKLYPAAPYRGTVPLAGQHQWVNAGLAVEVAGLLAERLPLSKQHITEGLAQATWPARLQRLTHGPLVESWGARGSVYLDGGHNAHAAEALAEWITAHHEPVIVICGLMRRKDAAAYLAPLSRAAAQIICVSIPHAPDALAPAELAAELAGAGVADSPQAALEQLEHVKKATVLVAGSLYLAGEVLKTHG